MHGFALNLNPDLRYFDRIIPCGIRGKGVTSLERELGYAPPRNQVEQQLREALARVWKAQIIDWPEGLEL